MRFTIKYKEVQCKGRWGFLSSRDNYSGGGASHAFKREREGGGGERERERPKNNIRHTYDDRGNETCSCSFYVYTDLGYGSSIENVPCMQLVNRYCVRKSIRGHGEERKNLATFFE